MEANQEETTEPPRPETNPSKRETLPQSLSAAYGNNTREMAMHQMSSRTGAHDLYRNDNANVESAMQYLLKEEWSYIYKHSIVAHFGESEGTFQYGNYFREGDDLHPVLRVTSAILGYSKGGNVVLLYASKYVTEDSLMECLNTNMPEACLQIDKDCNVLTVHGSDDTIV